MSLEEENVRLRGLVRELCARLQITDIFMMSDHRFIIPTSKANVHYENRVLLESPDVVAARRGEP